MLKNLLIFVMFLSLIASCVSLKCYSCMSSREGNCEDEKEMETKECEPGGSGFLAVKAVCMKVVKQIRSFEHITRSCGFEGDLLKPCNAFQSAEACTTCDTNLCNSSVNLIFNYSMLSLSLAVAIKYLLT